MHFIPILVALTSPANANGLVGQGTADDLAPVAQLVGQMRAASDRLQDSTYTLFKQSWDGQRLSPVEEVVVKYRRPNDVYLRWEGSVHAGRELTYQPSTGSDQMWIKLGPNVPAVSIDPNGRVARRASRHSVVEAGLVFAVDRIADDVERAMDRPDLLTTFTDLGVDEQNGAQVHCWEAELPKASVPDFYAARVQVCQDTATNLPTTISVWDDLGSGVQLVERFSFAEVEVNVGLDAGALALRAE
jgi:hypothetical protein